MNKHAHPLRWVLLILMIIMTACSASDQSSKDKPDSIVDSKEDSSSDDTASIQEGEEEITTTEDNSQLFIPVPDNTTIVQTTSEAGNGEHPLFAWEPVDGAVSYLLFVLREDGSGYWSWEGATTEIVLGGFDEPPTSEVGGPLLLEPMVWAVIALNAEDQFIASSPLRSVAP